MLPSTKNPLIIIEPFRGWVLSLLQKHELRVEEESALFRQVSRRPLKWENVESPKQAPPLAGSSERDDGIQVFLPFTFWRSCCALASSSRSVLFCTFPSPPSSVWPTQGRKGELTSCRVAKTSSESQKEGEPGCPRSPRGTGTTVLTYPCPSQPCFGGSEEVRQGSRQRW